MPIRQLVSVVHIQIQELVRVKRANAIAQERINPNPTSKLSPEQTRQHATAEEALRPALVTQAIVLAALAPRQRSLLRT